DGTSIDLENYEDLGLTFDRLLQLHGAERKSSGTTAAGSPTEGDLQAVASAMLRDDSLAHTVYQYFRPNGERRKFSQAQSAPWVPEDYGLSLSVSAVPGPDWSKDRYAVWDEF